MFVLEKEGAMDCSIDQRNRVSNKDERRIFKS